MNNNDNSSYYYQLKQLFMKYVVTLPFIAILTACGGGSFKANDAFYPKDLLPPQPPKPKKFQDDPNAIKRPDAKELTKLSEPVSGFEVKVPLRNFHPKTVENRAPIKLDSLVFKKHNIKKKEDGSLTNIPHEAELKKIAQDNYTFFLHSHDKYKESRKRDYMNHVFAGYAFAEGSGINRKTPEKYFYDFTAYLFMQGDNPSVNLPVEKTIKYKGTWDYVTDAVDDSSRIKYEFNSEFAYKPGDRVGALSFHEAVQHDKNSYEKVEYGHTSEFEVNFGTKKLTGNLYRNSIVKDNAQEKVLRYAVKADVKGNRFVGDAVASKKEHPLFGKDAVLEGGFYGPNAEELGGRFATTDESLVGVFGASRNHPDLKDQSKDISLDKILDAKLINKKSLEVTDIDNFGDATRIVIDGRSFSLLQDDRNIKVSDKLKLDKSICCTNLDYVKFGSLDIVEKDKETKSNLYIQGERTPTSKIPSEGQVKYVGAWDSFYEGSSGKVNGDHPNPKGAVAGNNRAEFDVNFADRKINGSLIATNGTSAAFKITADIEKNGFTGKANTVDTNGLNIDPLSTGASDRIKVVDATVTGAFYGPDASEMGGSFNSNDKSNGKAAVVFGAKRQTLK
ncbi:transferrin-binding protein-like solute binding protein [Taylorella equigenitalis]|uniref:transferrin-binding protein-like solute binding protein n=1 Tax=Taylorella equigenitalis TaxID=29575 RepID=UPI001CEF5881|nr:transferrin-binding protein-like solute binding protein [Taylorella equigenitalis]